MAQPTHRTVVALDVDGVINPDLPLSHGDPAWGPGWTRRDVTIPPMPLDLYTHPAMLDRLGGLAARPDVDLVWLTTWRDHANQHISPAAGWPTLPVIDFTDRIAAGWGHVHHLGHAGKADALDEWLTARPDITRVVWVDDAHLAPQGDLHRRLVDRDSRHVGALDQLAARDLLVVPTNPRAGLTVAAVDHLTGWIDTPGTPDPWMVLTLRHDMPPQHVAALPDRAAAIDHAATLDDTDEQVDPWGVRAVHVPMPAWLAAHQPADLAGPGTP